MKQSSVYPSLREQPAASVDSVLKKMLGVLTEFMWNQYDEYGLETMRDDMLFMYDWRAPCRPKTQTQSRLTQNTVSVWASN